MYEDISDMVTKVVKASTKMHITTKASQQDHISLWVDPKNGNQLMDAM